MKNTILLMLAVLLLGCDSSSSTDSDTDADTDSDAAAEPSTDTTKPADMPCTPEDADTDELACITWSTESGPCTDEQTACRINPDCLSYLGCYDAAFSLEDYQSERQRCNDLYPDGSEDYWTYMRCMYCQACGTECSEISGAVCFW